jgi:hypothetical protein
MSRIGRKAVVAASIGIAAAVDAMLSVVACFAQALELAEAELVPIAVVRLDVIGDGRWDNAALLLACGAQGLEGKLVAAADAPALQAIPGPPLVRGSGIGERRGHGSHDTAATIQRAS